MPEPTIAITVRLSVDEHAALEKTATFGKKTEYIRRLLRLDLQRRGILPAEKQPARRRTA